jgi:hypothetical protein
MEKVISVEQFNHAVEMITATPSEAAVFSYRGDPFVHRMVSCIKMAISSNGVANNQFDLTQDKPSQVN